MRWLGCVFAALLLCAPVVCQSPGPRCDANSPPSAACNFPNSPGSNRVSANSTTEIASLANAANRTAIAMPASQTEAFITIYQEPPQPGFRWGRALLESFELLTIEQSYVVHTDWKWVGGGNSENGVPFNHYWRDYKQSLSAWVHAGWNDGDPNMYGYLGHPIQGLAASYIFLQNDPKSENLQFSKTKAYWKSRLKATVWNAVYSTQWNIGPLSEMTVEKYGTHWRSPWNQDGSWPCNTNHCYTGVGQIDLAMTPIGGIGWLVGEDILDRYITRRVEASTPNRVLIDITRIGLDPVSAGTNMLHGQRPWYRSRDNKRVRFNLQLASAPSMGRPSGAADRQ